MKIENSKGTVYYGMHFYPGVAEYSPPGADPYRVFLNEDTIRAMDPSFAGRPVYVMHVDDVPQKIDEVRREADGWVVESFFNSADGKHWVKFLVVSERGERAIRQHMRLSNCYIPKGFTHGGVWNGVSYQKEITNGEYEHLALVPDPRYAESVVLTPDEFKAYNEAKNLELTRLANERDAPVKLSIFKRTKVENSVDLAEMMVALPKSKRELSIEAVVNAYDEHLANEGKTKVANGDHLVKVGDSEMTLNELLEKHKSMSDELCSMKEAKANADKEVEEALDAPGGDVDHVKENAEDEDEAMENADDDEDEDDKKKKANKKKNEDKKKNEADDAAAAAKKKADKEKADRVRNAKLDAENMATAPVVQLQGDRIALGRSRYGS